MYVCKKAWKQSHYREVALWEISKKNIVGFGLVFGRLAVLKTIWVKKFGVDYDQLLRAFFSSFHVQKSCIAYEAKKITKEFFIGYKTSSIVSCSTIDTSPRDLCIVTLPGNRPQTGIPYIPTEQSSFCIQFQSELGQ